MEQRENLVYDLPSTAFILNVSEETVLDQATRGRLPGIQVNGQWHFTSEALETWTEQQFSQPLPPEAREALEKQHKAQDLDPNAPPLTVEEFEKRYSAGQ